MEWMSSKDKDNVISQHCLHNLVLQTRYCIRIFVDSFHGCTTYPHKLYHDIVHYNFKKRGAKSILPSKIGIQLCIQVSSLIFRNCVQCQKANDVDNQKASIDLLRFSSKIKSPIQSATYKKLAYGISTENCLRGLLLLNNLFVNQLPLPSPRAYTQRLIRPITGSSNKAPFEYYNHYKVYFQG